MIVHACPIDQQQTIGGCTLEELSDREFDVIRLITEGHSNQEIAEELYLSMNTVKTYVRSGYRKIGATRRSHAVIWGARNGLLQDLPYDARIVAAS